MDSPNVFIMTGEPTSNPDVPVFVIHKEADVKSKQTFHRIHLLPVGHLTAETPKVVLGASHSIPNQGKTISERKKKKKKNQKVFKAERTAGESERKNESSTSAPICLRLGE